MACLKRILLAIAFIAREIHDELGQLLTGMKFDLKWLEKRLPVDSPGPDSAHSASQTA